MQIKLKLHSIIDVITNSSTEIYTFMNSNAKEQGYELLNEILQVALGRDTEIKAEDLFDIIIEPCDLECLFDIIDLEDIPEELIEEDIKLLKETYDSFEDWNERNNYFNDIIEPYFMKDDKWKYLIDYYDDGELSSSNKTTMSIIAKNKERSATDIMDLFFNLFHQEASNG
jgi:hypothetical protein